MNQWRPRQANSNNNNKLSLKSLLGLSNSYLIVLRIWTEAGSMVKRLKRTSGSLRPFYSKSQMTKCWNERMRNITQPLFWSIPVVFFYITLTCLNSEVVTVLAWVWIFWKSLIGLKIRTRGGCQCWLESGFLGNFISEKCKSPDF